MFKNISTNVDVRCFLSFIKICVLQARLAQSVEHETLNLRVVGSSPTLGARVFFFITLELQHEA